MASNYRKLGRYIREIDRRNTENRNDNLLGLSVAKCFIPSIANTVGTDFRKYKVVEKGQFAYIPDTSRRGDKIAIALLEGWDSGLVSNVYTVFEIVGEDLLPKYLELWFRRPEFDRYTRFKSHGSVREIFDWEQLCDVELPIPSISEQQKIVDSFNAIDRRINSLQQLNDKLAEFCNAIFRNFVDCCCDDTWHNGTLNELVDIRYGKDHKRLADGSYPVYGSGGYIRSVEKYLMSGESVLIPRKGTLNNVMYVDEEFWTVDTMFYTIPRIPGAAKYTFQHLKKLDLTSMNSGSAVPSMTTAILNALELPIPSHEALYELDERLQPMYTLTAANKKENERLSILRDSLLSKLMSGEVDVDGIDVQKGVD